MHLTILSDVIVWYGRPTHLHRPHTANSLPYAHITHTTQTHRNSDLLSSHAVSAGGEKYLCGSIFFKYAVDLFGIYGSDHYAQKAAGLELKHLNTLFSLGRICSFPLMCIVRTPHCARCVYVCVYVCVCVRESV